MAVGAAVAARLGLLHVTAVWPSFEYPEIAFDPSHAWAAEWARGVLEPAREVHRYVAPATWHALRSRAALIVTGRPRAISVVERALKHPLDRPSLLFLSSNGSRGKVTYFVFEGEGTAPVGVVKVMANPRHSEWLKREASRLELLRGHLTVTAADAVADALPPAAMLTEEIDGDFLLVEPTDPLGDKAFQVNRDRALAWLRAFHDATSQDERPWSEEDEQSALTLVADVWKLYRPEGLERAAAATAERLRRLRKAPVRRCFVHGDYWPGNIASDGRAMRVFDWEWCSGDSPPFVDHWTYELCPLRPVAAAREHDLTELLAQAAERVRHSLETSGVDGAFALATLAPVVADLVSRTRKLTGEPNGWELAAGSLLAATESIIA